MAKQRHTEAQTSSRSSLIALVVGALVVAGLVVWALTRTVEPASTTATLEQPAGSTSEPIGSATSPVGLTQPPPPVSGNRDEVARISAEDLRAKFNRGEVTVIDVRDATSYANGHIPGSMNIPFASTQGMIDLVPRGKEIVTYCT
jgi:hypothetical protein